MNFQLTEEQTHLQEIARDTGGQFFATADAQRLQTVYANLGTRLTKTKEKQQVTSAFAGGADSAASRNGP